MKVAVVGSGVSGLVCAWLLRRAHEVTVFEAEDRIGGHTHTHDIVIDDRSYAIDTGFIVYNERTYPNFIRLLDELGVASQRTSMSFSASNAQSGIEYCGSSPNTLFAQRRNLLKPRFWRMLAEIVRFNLTAPRLLPDQDRQDALRGGWAGLGEELTLGTFLAERGYSRTFAENYLLGMAAAIWSCPPDEAAAIPVRAFIRFFDNHGLLDLWGRPKWRVVEGGSREYLRLLTRGFAERIHTAAPVRRISRRRDSRGACIGVTIDLEQHSGLEFDAVVLACHSDQALAVLADPSAGERRILGAIPYQNNDVVLHTDETLLPRARRAWASWNYFVGDGGGNDVTVTYNMNLLQGIESDTTFCVTLNRTRAIDPGKILRTLRLSLIHI